MDVEWFTALLVGMLELLPAEYRRYLSQARDGIVRRVYKPGFASTDSHTYIGIGYHPDIADKYEDPTYAAAYEEFLDGVEIRQPDLMEPTSDFPEIVVEGLAVWNTALTEYVPVQLWLGYGLIMGIDCTPPMDMATFDNTRIILGELKVTSQKAFLSR